MINKTPTGWTEYLEANLGNEINQNREVHDATCWRVSALLGPDGNPLMISIPRQRVGFYVDKKDSTK